MLRDDRLYLCLSSCFRSGLAIGRGGMSSRSTCDLLTCEMTIHPKSQIHQKQAPHGLGSSPPSRVTNAMIAEKLSLVTRRQANRSLKQMRDSFRALIPILLLDRQISTGAGDAAGTRYVTLKLTFTPTSLKSTSRQMSQYLQRLDLCFFRYIKYSLYQYTPKPHTRLHTGFTGFSYRGLAG